MNEKQKGALVSCVFLSLIFIVPLIVITIQNWSWDKQIMPLALIITTTIIWGIGAINILPQKTSRRCTKTT